MRKLKKKYIDVKVNYILILFKPNDILYEPNYENIL